ncbi:MAG: translation initiation factor IF-3 [Clostridia bacterium]|nr:translation initiation factor IF-3 [Clostridia bacterium]
MFCPLCFYQNWRCFNISKQEVLINEKIRCDELRVIGTDGAQLGIMSSDAALKLAFEQNLDLVLIAAQAKPPVGKIMDYGKYRFELAKKEKEAKKNQKVINIKEVQL